jgi:serine protease Do
MVVALGLLAMPAARADVARRRSAVVDVVQKVGPAVVFIGTEQVVDRRMRGTPLEEFFFGEGGRRERQTVQSLGSGVIIDPVGDHRHQRPRHPRRIRGARGAGGRPAARGRGGGR